MKNWVALFSQTGSEIVDLALHFNRWPDIIITNNRYNTVAVGLLRKIINQRLIEN